LFTCASFSSFSLQITFAGDLLVQPLTPLPVITDVIAMRAGPFAVVVDGQLQASNTNGLELDAAAGPSLLDGFTVRNFALNGVVCAGAGHVLRNLTVASNGLYGVMAAADHFVITDSVLCNNTQAGIWIVGFNASLIGNYIGLTRSGAAWGNVESGVYVTGQSVRIGGAGPGQGNVISGNRGDGVFVTRYAVDALVQGNVIGLNPAGTAAVPNLFDGVHADADRVTVLDNVVSANFRCGVFASGNFVGIRGNIVGLNKAGGAMLGNRMDGLCCYGSNHVIGGSQTKDRNIVSGNVRNGLASQSPNIWVENNFWGCDISGTIAMPNGQTGIYSQETNTTVLNNVISGNTLQGIQLFSDSAVIQGTAFCLK
jgi:hypothetical protein